MLSDTLQDIWRHRAEINRVKESQPNRSRRLIWKIDEGDKELLVIYDVRSKLASSPPAVMFVSLNLPARLSDYPSDLNLNIWIGLWGK